MHRIFAHEITDEPIVSHSDDESEDNKTFDLGRDTFDMEYPPMLSVCTTHERGDSTIGIDKTIRHQTIKRRRSNSLPLTSTSGNSSTSLLPYNEGSRELVSDSDSEDSRADDICSKQRKVSTLHYRIVSRNSRSEPSPPVSDNDEGSEEDDGTLSNSLDTRLTSPSKSTTATEVTSPIELKVYLVVTDVDQDWDVRKIISKEDLDGVSYYLVVWYPILLPKHSLGHTKELVDKFEARIRAQRGVNNKRRGLGSKTRQKASVKDEALGGQQGRKP